MRRRDLLSLTAAGLAAPTMSRAQESWHDRTARLIVPFLPGGSTDTIARIMQPKMNEALGRPAVIENRSRASGSLGAIEVARTTPDGCTWLLASGNEATTRR